MSALRSGVCGLAFLAAIAGCERCTSTSTPTPTASATATPTASATGPLASLAWDDAPLDWSRPVPPVPAGGLAEPGYVGSEACKPCHAALFKSYERHAMAKTGIRPLASLAPRALAAMFDSGAKQPVRHDKSGYTYRALREKDAYFVEETIAGDGGAVHVWRQPITHTLSAGRYGMAFYTQKGSAFLQTPLDYYPTASRFDLDPGAVEGNPRFSRPLDALCIGCHSDYPRRSADTVFPGAMPAGVGCERCHGPGEAHAKSVRREDVVNPARLSPARQLDVCAQCHQLTLADARVGRDDFSFRPGEPLDDFRVNHVGEPAAPERFTLLAHVERLARSACFARSAGKMTCTTCHDAHKSSFDQPESWWDGKCTECHAEKRCAASAQARAAEANHCARCHMRKGPPNNPRLVTVTDHWIQRRPPAVVPGPPGDEPAEKIVPWATFMGEPSRGDDLAAIEAIEAMRGKTDAAALARAMDGWPRVPQLYAFAASWMRSHGDVAGASRGFRAALRLAPDNRASLLGYAHTMLDAHAPESDAEAIRALDRILALDENDAAALETKAIVLFRGGRVDDARTLFARAAASGAAAGASHVALAVTALRAGRRDEAVAELGLARRAEPSDGWVLGKLAELTTGDARAEVSRAAAFFAARGGKGPSAASRWLPPEWR